MRNNSQKLNYDHRKLPSVTLITDGACQPNPGNGGWAVILRSHDSDRRLVLSGSEANTTNNRMELRAAVEGLRALKCRCEVVIRTDSTILLGIVNRSGKKPSRRKNSDLVFAILAECDKHVCSAEWVKGHSGDADNEEADQLASDQARGKAPF